MSLIYSFDYLHTMRLNSKNIYELTKQNTEHSVSSDETLMALITRGSFTHLILSAFDFGIINIRKLTDDSNEGRRGMLVAPVPRFASGTASLNAANQLCGYSVP